MTEDTTNKVCENFTLLHEDPLFRIMQEEQRMKEKILNNPLDMKKIYDQLEQQTKKHKKSKKSHKRSRSKDKRSRSKDKKKAEKHKKKEKKHRKRSSSSSSSSSKERNNRQYEEYLAKKLGPILVKDEYGNLKADFGLMKRKFRNNLREEEKLKMT